MAYFCSGGRGAGGKPPKRIKTVLFHNDPFGYFLCENYGEKCKRTVSYCTGGKVRKDSDKYFAELTQNKTCLNADTQPSLIVNLLLILE